MTVEELINTIKRELKENDEAFKFSYPDDDEYRSPTEQAYNIMELFIKEKYKLDISFAHRPDYCVVDEEGGIDLIYGEITVNISDKGEIDVLIDGYAKILKTIEKVTEIKNKDD